MSEIANLLETQSREILESEMPKLLIRFAEEKELTPDQLKLLREMINMFDRYHNSEMNLHSLKGILYLLSNPDTEIMIPRSNQGFGKSLFMFEEKMSVKGIVQIVLGMVRNSSKIKTAEKDLPKFKTIITNKFHKNDEKNKFSVNPQDLENIRMNFAKREKTKHSINNGEQKLTDIGRIIRYSNEAKRAEKFQVLPTILNSIRNGNYSLKEKKFHILKSDFLFPEYEENVIYNIMLVLDSSNSISWVIPHIEKFISYITSNASNARDKLGLITFKNDLAQIYHYPTLNVKQIIGTINKIETKGQTPLGDGLNLALQVLSREQYKIPGMKNLIILISDCYPEPLEGGHKDLLNEPSYKLVISVAEKIKEAKLGLIIINPTDDEKEKPSWARKLIDKIVSLTEAKYIEVHPEYKFSFLGDGKAVVDDNTLTEFFDVVNDVKLEL
ncbi:MAG: VWA domain-containing protein [Candidatus Cloacimonetes bacterium]|nr:VWA domain-containing protein [Candidatus Cloacimonadota bacterium]